MLEHLKEKSLELFSNTMKQLAVFANRDPEKEGIQIPEIPRFSMEELMACFVGAKKESFLTEKPLERLIDSLTSISVGGSDAQNENSTEYKDLAEDEFNLPSIIPEGTRVTLTLFATDRNGLVFPTKYYNDETNTSYPYFQVLYSDPSDPSGNAKGLNNTRPVPYLKLLPEKLELQTSFVVEYAPGQERKENESDYTYFTRMLSEKYQRLQELAHGCL